LVFAVFELKLFVQQTCPKCPAAKAVAEELRKKRKDMEVKTFDISDEENRLTALMLQISSTPAFAIGEEILFVGEVPTVDELNRKLDEYSSRVNK
jgi:glutaredoxin